MTEKKIYTILGDKIRSLESFYKVIGREVNGKGGYFGKNLDAFIDCLRGGFGTPKEFILRWENSEKSRIALGYKETVRQLKKRLKRAHPSNHDKIKENILLAKQKKGPSVFDWLTEIIIKAENVELILE
jgi:RNAse (barnase) inhibitor barstar